MNPSRLVGDLQTQIKGDVLTSPQDLDLFSRDESIFQIAPAVVVAPINDEDLQTIVQVAKEHQVSITARGGGTSVAGQSIGSGIVVDFSKHFSKILHYSVGQALVQPGVILDDLNRELAKKGERFAPDPSSRAWCTIGGMVGNNASGPHGLKYGDTRKNVTNVKVLLADGSTHWTTDLALKLSGITPTLKSHRKTIEKSFLEITKNSSGYDLKSLLQNPKDFTQLVVGSEGTLCLTTEIEVKTIPLPQKTTTVLYSFDSVEAAASFGLELRTTGPSSIELMNHWILDALKTQDAPFIESVKLSNAKATLWVEWEGDVPSSVKENGFVISDPETQTYIWKLRSIASKIVQNLPGSRKALRCIEDGVVPLKALKTYSTELQNILLRHDCDGSIFGHVGDAHLHVNPRFDLEKPHLAQRIENVMDETNSLIFKLGGSISGEHGDGLLRGKYMEQQWGSLNGLFQTVRKEFGATDIFNPDKKISNQNELSLLLQKSIRPAFCLQR